MTRRRVLACAAGLALLAAVPMGGCRDLVGIESDPPTKLVAEGGAPVRSCGVSFANVDCADCMKTACCDEGDRCAGAAGCAGFAECVAKCGNDLTCTAQCRVPGGYGAEAAALESCKAKKCAGACEVTKCGGYVYADGKCGECGVANCCEVATACVGDVDCVALAACERACALGPAIIDGGNCLERCELDRPAGVGRQRAFGLCLRESCAKECIQPQWACLENGSRSEPATGAAIKLTYRFIDYPSLERVPNLTVRACTFPDPGLTCATPSKEGVTNAPGEAVLPLEKSSFDGYAEVSGTDYGTTLIYVPRLTKDFVGFFGLPKEATFSGLTTLVLPDGGVLQPDRGNLVVSVIDCTGAAAAGVALTIEPSAGSVPFYFNKGSPQRVPAVQMTDDDANIGGYGGFLNVPANTPITVHATVVQNGRKYADQQVMVRPLSGPPGTPTALFSVVRLYATPP